MTDRLAACQVLDIAKQRLQIDKAAIDGLIDQLGNDFVTCVDLLRTCVGKVLVTGMGTSGATARRVAHLLAVGGTPAVFVHAADGLHGSLGVVTPGDIVIAISKGGESDELNEYARRARDRGAQLISMTSVADSTLAHLADQVLVTVTPEGSDPGGMMAMGSALAQCALGDALICAVMSYRDDVWQAFKHAHPGGAVGKRIAAEED